MPALLRFKPELIVVPSGLRRRSGVDPLGRMMMNVRGLPRHDALADERGAPICAAAAW